MFAGYSPETVDFLWGIRMNNNRDWFLSHKSDYVQYLYEPTKALGKELFQPFLEKTGDVLKVSRIYRDARMHHPLPYKESLWICIRKDVEWWAENPCLFFEIKPEGIGYGFFWWKPKPQAMADLRADIAARPREFLKLIRDTEKAVGQKIEAECYKRPKEAPDPKLQPYFGWKGQIDCTWHEDFSPEVFGENLLPRVQERLNALIPLYEYLCRFGTSA